MNTYFFFESKNLQESHDFNICFLPICSKNISVILILFLQSLDWSPYQTNSSDCECGMCHHRKYIDNMASEEVSGCCLCHCKHGNCWSRKLGRFQCCPNCRCPCWDPKRKKLRCCPCDCPNGYDFLKNGKVKCKPRCLPERDRVGAILTFIF